MAARQKAGLGSCLSCRRAGAGACKKLSASRRGTRSSGLRTRPSVSSTRTIVDRYGWRQREGSGDVGINPRRLWSGSCTCASGVVGHRVGDRRGADGHAAQGRHGAIDSLVRHKVTSTGIVTHDDAPEQQDEVIAMVNSSDSIKVLMRPDLAPKPTGADVGASAQGGMESGEMAQSGSSTVAAT